ncbi:MAG TPA: ATPase, T2SS/T4P/T4SS family [Nitriliruptoraceae bacterium]|nr:ATPase, T2SS/T4P/T4SS family [Nitriliruptoraceae bacterium]
MARLSMVAPTRERGALAASDVVIDAALRDAVMGRVCDDPEAAAHANDRVAVRRAVARALAAEGVVVAPARWARMVRDLVDEIAGLGPIESLLRDPAVTDVCCNGPDEVWVDRDGRLERTAVSFRDSATMVAVVRRVLSGIGGRLDRLQPCVDGLLPGGVRLHAAIPPVVPRPVLTLRRVAAIVPTWDQYVAGGMVTPPLRDLLCELVTRRRNLVVSGPAGSGKTTLLSRLLGEVGDDRVVVIEDTPELVRTSRHVVAMSVVAPGRDGGGVDLHDLVRQSLRMRPDRLVVGEVRGTEVASLLQAMNTGHQGSATTVHANSAAEALVRLEGMALLAGLPLAAARAQVDAAIDVVVALRRDGGRRRVESVVEVGAADGVRRLERVWGDP